MFKREHDDFPEISLEQNMKGGIWQWNGNISWRSSRFQFSWFNMESRPTLLHLESATLIKGLN